MKLYNRCSGVLMHITSLPSNDGIGCFNNQSFEFVDLLEKAHIKLWQILPLSKIGKENSPYSSISTFAGNDLFISLEKLCEMKLLNNEDLKNNKPTFDVDKVDYEKVTNYKIPLLNKAANKFVKLKLNKSDEYKLFIKNNSFWLDSYAIFMAISEINNSFNFIDDWDSKLANRNQSKLHEFEIGNKDRIEELKIIQFFFYKQWFELKSYANKKGVKIIGDVPIFVAKLSVETWSNPEIFKTDANGNMSFVSGYPPDDDGNYGQEWGNPVYDWDKMEKNDFKFQIARLKFLLKVTDYLRLDHFIGYSHYWEIPNNGKAIDGKWVDAKGKEMFEKLRMECPDLPIIAEDLGAMTPEVKALRDNNNFPGMRNFLYAFDFRDKKLNTENEYLPCNYIESCVAYTATHDNEMLKSWFIDKSEFEKKEICRYLESDEEHICDDCIKAIFESKAVFVVIPIQDFLHKTSECRMNFPGTVSDLNWTYKLANFDEFKLVVDKIRSFNIHSNR